MKTVGAYFTSPYILQKLACMNPDPTYSSPFKDIHSCLIEIIKGLTEKGQFQYLTKLKGPQEGTYLYTTQYLSLT